MMSVSKPLASLESPYPFGEPGKPLLLYAGPLSVALETSANGTLEETGEGNVWFHMLPSPRVSWEAFVTSTDLDFKNQALLRYFSNVGVRLSSILDSGWLVETIGTAQELAMPDRPLVEGEFSFSFSLDAPFEIGDGEGLAEVRFNLINFPFMRGNAQVKHYCGVEGFDDGVRPYRFDLPTGDGWEVALDPREDFQAVWGQAKEQESYVFTHVGRLRKTDGSSFRFDEAQDILNMLYWFLSFMTGRRVGVVLPVGYENVSKPPVFVRWDSRVTQAAKGSLGWYDERCGADDLAEMFLSFRELWRDDYWQEIILRAIYTYTHAQEGTWADVMMAQSALETLAWAVLVDPQHRLIKDESECLNAVDKVRKLLRWAGEPSSLPSAYDLLGPKAAELMNETDPSKRDGPRAVTWLRNRITHPKMTKPPFEAFFECRWALLGYVELVLLRLLDYRGSYADRMERYAPQYGSFGDRKPYWHGADVRPVPWATPTEDLLCSF